MKLIAATIIAASIASPAFAQSYDPEMGTGNVQPSAYAPTSYSGYAARQDARRSYGAVRDGQYRTQPRWYYEQRR